ncbi:unnamed protein product [Caenorhabditis angaria]|uniref:Uncharacterized protein n=1 Tax=Caenorhabditis angaria TaxID=860376 RepID=A0A9P1I9S2_9PELO|nr:unnamed protein product [Caenorhabditis angaria]
MVFYYETGELAYSNIIQQVVFLGDYKPENVGNKEWRKVERTNGENELIRCILVDGRMIGALLIGETNLEETMENMILNGVDLRGIEETFLEPSVEIDDFFD